MFNDLAQMTIEQLEKEKSFWQRKLDKGGMGWNYETALAAHKRRQCDRWLRLKRKEKNRRDKWKVR